MELKNSYISSKNKYLLSFMLAGLTAVTITACNSDRGEKFSRNSVDKASFGKIQEDIHASLLKKYVDSEKSIHYAAWKNSVQDVESLKAVLTAMAKADTSALSPDGKKAFYINAYNAMTIDLILEHYDETMGGSASPYPSARSIRNIGNLDDKVWDFYKWQISGQQLSLNDIEHKILRPMGDARIHFAIVCASKGCPPILNKAFSEDSINETLDLLADDFVNSERNTKINVKKNEIKTSKILDWFSQDFINSYGSVANFFAKYSKAASPEQIQGMKIKYNIYDWLLNESTQSFGPAPKTEDTPEKKENQCGEESLGSGSETPPECQ